MLFINKSNVWIKDLLSGVYDLHTHLIPGVDDGAETLEQSLNLIGQMRMMNIKGAVCTPHVMVTYPNNLAMRLKESFNHLQENAPNDFKLVLAAEYMVDENLMKHVESRDLLLLDGNRMLIETASMAASHNFKDTVFELCVSGYTPIVAHPERYVYIHGNMKRYYSLKNEGCEFQLNILALAGFYGSTVMKVALDLLEAGLYDYLGTDIHNLSYLKFLEKKISIKKGIVKELERLKENNEALIL